MTNAADCKVWQALSLKRKPNFFDATLAGVPALIKDSASRGFSASYEYSRRQRLPTSVAREVLMTEQIKTNRPYPMQLKLRDGHSAAIRVMEPSDLDLIIDFARNLPADDLLFLRTDITDLAVVQNWIDNIKQGHTITLLAEVEGELAAYASVHLEQARWTRRVGEIRIITSSRYRGAGLGRRLAAEVFDLARSLGLKKITAQMTTDQTSARAAFEHLGFQVEAVLSDWVEDRRGRSRDLLIMTYDVAGFSDRIVA
jgi:RimJ/RimL family protein N-acetyltransferase